MFQQKGETKETPIYVHKKLGICDPDLSNVLPFEDIFKRKRFEKSLQENTFNLGNGISTKSVSEAVDLFVKRYFFC